MNIMTNDSEALIDIVERIFNGENPSIVNSEIQEYLDTVDPALLNIAEDKLKKLGFKKEEIMSICSDLNEMIQNEVEGKILLKQLLVNLDQEHPIHMLICENDKILDFLNLLDMINRNIQEMNIVSFDKNKIRIVSRIADLILGKEYHLQKEEDILFPELEKRGVNGQIKVMITEHKLMKIRCKNLKELVDHFDEMTFSDFKDQLDDNVNYLIPMMRDNIYKENNILFPKALNIITDDTVWKALRNHTSTLSSC